MSIKKILALGLIIGALLFWWSHAHADSNTVNPIDSLNPTSGTYGSAAYPGQLYNFLAKEDANRYLEQGFGNYVVSGCLGIVSAGLVMTPSSCIAYNAGYRSTETGAITFGSGQTYWVAMDENTSGSNAGLPNFTRAGTTHYLIDSLDAAQPAMPNDAQLLMKVTTLAGAITAVSDLRVLTPNFALAITTLHANLNANGFRITGLGANTTIGDALSQGISHLNDLATAIGNYSMGANSLLYAGGTSGTVTTKAQAVAGTWTFQWPSSAGSNGNVLSTDGTGIASWIAAPSAVPSGNAPQVVGYSALNTPESETVSGDFAFTRAGANSYTAAVTKVNGNAVSSTAPTGAQIWVENAGATSMVPVSITGDCTITAAGAITCTKINGVTPGGTCTNQFVSAVSASAVPTCTTATLAGPQFANQGTTTTLAHGNAAGNPSWAAVSLTTDVSGVLPQANGGTNSYYLDVSRPGTSACGTAAETTLYTISIPGGTLSTGNELHVTLNGNRLKNGGGLDTASVRVKYGATTLMTLAAPLVTLDSATLENMQLICDLDAAGATNSQTANCTLAMTQTPGGQSGSGLSGEYGTATEDSTGAKTLAVTYQWVNAGTSAQHCITTTLGKIQVVHP